MPKVNYVSKARKDVPNSDIKAGESYYWWKFRFGGKHVSRTRPRASQLTQSGFLSQAYAIQERIEDTTYFESKDQFDEFKEEIISDLDNLQDECQTSLDNMPESLQESPTGQLLQERIDAIEDFKNEIEAIEVDEPVDEDDDNFTQELEEALQNALEELQACTFNV